MLFRSLGRAHAANEPEDHLAGLLEVMRHLILGEDDARQTAFQKEFFLRYIGGAYAALTEMVIATGGANFYKDVARLTRAFLDVESQSFDMV